jgi:DnaJ-class molecular chaperone
MGWTDNFKRYDTSNGFGNGRKWRESFYERISDQDAAQILKSQDETPYSLLGITETATQDEIKKSFRQKITEWHPDRNQHRESEATAMSKKIIAAYTLLSKK